MRYESKRSFDKIKYCTKCKYVWETGYCISNRCQTIYKYSELSSYKLDRQTCANCERKRNGNNSNGQRIKKLAIKHC